MLEQSKTLQILKGLFLELVRLRPKSKSDEPFIYSSWLQSNRVRHPNMPKNDYYQHYKELIKNVLEKSEVMIACDPNDDDFFFGYMIVRIIDDIKILHYAYTKKPFRRFGVQRKLAAHFNLRASDPIIITCKKPDFLNKIDTLYKPELKKL